MTEVFMKILTLLALSFSLFFVVLSSAEEKKGGWLRDKLKERFVKKQQAKPAPAASKDIKAKIENPGDYTFVFSHGGFERYYKVHVPEKYSPKTATPLLIAMHGGGGDMEVQSSDEYYKQISTSNAEGYIVVFPNGYSQFKSGKIGTWNAGKCCAFARDKNIDDVGFIKEMITHLQNQLNIDRTKIFADGMSNGGMMAYRLACEMPDTFKAIASVAGTDGTTSCNPKKPISILHIHAKDDDHVLFTGGAGKNAFRDESQVTDFVSVPDTIAKWVKLNSCEGKPTRNLEKPGAYCEKYVKCKNNTEVQLCVTETGGHSWPGGKKPRGGGNSSTAISANDVIWEFFKSAQ